MQDSLIKSKVVNSKLIELVFAEGRRFAIKVEGKYERWFMKESDAKACFDIYHVN